MEESVEESVEELVLESVNVVMSSVVNGGFGVHALGPTLGHWNVIVPGDGPSQANLHLHKNKEIIAS